jgi:hypothetical protein
MDPAPLTMRGRRLFSGREVLTEPSFNCVFLRGGYQPLVFHHSITFAIFGHKVLITVEDENEAVFAATAVV